MYGASVLFAGMNPAKYEAVDLGLEGSLLAGMVGGYVTGLLSGILISMPALFNGELMSMLLFAGVGVLGGLLRDLAPEKEDIWRFSPIFSLNPRRLRQRPYQLRLMFQLGCLFTIMFCGLLRGDGCAVANQRSGVSSRPSGMRRPGYRDRSLRQLRLRRHASAENLEQHAQRERSWKPSNCA